MEYVRGLGNDFVLRLRAGAFRVYNREGQEVELLGQFEGLGEGESRSIEVYYRVEGRDMPVRICALRKEQESEQAGLERLKKISQHKTSRTPGKCRTGGIQPVYSSGNIVGREHIGEAGAGSVPDTVADRAGVQTIKITVWV
jgi:hypothetical protein